jgi:hypothetical protein
MLNRLQLLFLPLLFWGQYTLGQSRDSIYYNNFVNHSDGTPCNHTPLNASFIAYVNSDHSKILVENAPRWSPGDANIKGNGIYGLEAANFISPSFHIGDTLTTLFICQATGQQMLTKDVCSQIPWDRFPLFVKLATVTLPPVVNSPSMFKDTLDNGYRKISWTVASGATYRIYRRSFDDQYKQGESRMLYSRVAENLSSSPYRDTSALANKRYGYIIVPVISSGVLGTHSAELVDDAGYVSGEDFSVGWIARLPRLDYIWNSQDPEIDGWPRVGQQVTWQANVKSWFASDKNNVSYKWLLDGASVDSGSITLSAGKITAVHYNWIWTFERHTLTFVIDNNSEVPEEEERNNSLTIWTNAIAAGFYVEQGIYDYFHSYQKDLKVGSNGWEDWAERHVARWNQMLAGATFPESPNGVLDRIRIDNVTVVPTGALPLAGGSYPTNMPNLNDRTVDLQWGFVADQSAYQFYSNHTSLSDNNPFYFEGSLFHELGHARYLIDLYGFNVHDNGTGNTIGILENGSLIVAGGYVPRDRYTPVTGLMNGQYTWVDRYSAACLNLIAGRRAVLGNYNAPGNIGVFLNDLPNENRFTIRDDIGNTLPGAIVKVYQATGQSGVWYGKYFDNIPDLTLTADAQGRVLLGKCPFSADGTIEHTYGLSNGVIIIGIHDNAKFGYTYFDSYLCNLQYWTGNKSIADYELRVTLNGTVDVIAHTSNIPRKSGLEQNYPNPFNPSTTFRFSVAHAGNVSLEVFDVLGKKLATIVSTCLQPGIYSFPWEAKNINAGVYFYRLNGVGLSETKKLTILK